MQGAIRHVHKQFCVRGKPMYDQLCVWGKHVYSQLCVWGKLLCNQICAWGKWMWRWFKQFLLYLWTWTKVILCWSLNQVEKHVSHWRNKLAGWGSYEYKTTRPTLCVELECDQVKWFVCVRLLFRHNEQKALCGPKKGRNNLSRPRDMHDMMDDARHLIMIA